VILRCLHGSWLYGLQRPESDIDYYEIYGFRNQRYRPRKQSAQTINGKIDLMRISVDRFEDLCYKGVPQAVEVLFAPPEAWVLENGWQDIAQNIKSELPKHMPAILETYKRTALNFYY